MEVRNVKWSEQEFLAKRGPVLARWPTGKDVDLDEAIEYHKQLPEGKVFSKVLEKAKSEGWIPIFIEEGHATVEETLGHKQMVDEAGADLVLINADASTKSCRFEEAQHGIEESVKAGKSMLSGYPYVNHGVKALRGILEATRSPFEVSAISQEEPMLCAEIGHAAGGTANGVIALAQLLARSKNYPLDRRIANSQYTARLAAYYTEHGAPIVCQITTPIHGYIPSGVMVAIAILQCLLNAEQGATHICLRGPSQYNLFHDVAVIGITRELAQEYLHRFGYEGVRLFVASWPWQGQWPRDPYRAGATVGWQTTIAVLGRADWINIRSIQEGVCIAQPAANVASIKIAKQVMLMLSNQNLPDIEEVKIEKEMLRLEIKAIVDKVIELGDGDLVAGHQRAIERGVIDVPFSPWIHVAGKVLSIRDRQGILRWLDYGNLPLPKQAIDFHRQRIADREKSENRNAGVDMVIDDISRLSRMVVREMTSTR